MKMWGVTENEGKLLLGELIVVKRVWRVKCSRWLTLLALKLLSLLLLVVALRVQVLKVLQVMIVVQGRLHQTTNVRTGRACHSCNARRTCTTSTTSCTTSCTIIGY